jgi:hypothetical protein
MTQDNKLKWYEKLVFREFTGLVTDKEYSATHFGTQEVTLYTISSDTGKTLYCGLPGSYQEPTLGDWVRVVVEKGKSIANRTKWSWKTNTRDLNELMEDKIYYAPILAYEVLEQKLTDIE